MRFILAHDDAQLARFGLDRASLEFLAEIEEDFLASNGVHDNRFFGTFGVQAPLPPPQQQQQQLLPPHLHPAVPARWAWIAARIENRTNTYHSYSAGPGAGQRDGHFPGVRVYHLQRDGTYRWAALTQVTVLTLAGSPNKILPRMVRDVGGNRGAFSSRKAMAEFVLRRERPLRVLREDDRREIFGGNFPVDVGPPAADCFWGVGRLDGGGSLAIARSTQLVLETP